MTKSLRCLLKDVLAEAVAHKHAFPEPQRVALVEQGLDVQRREGAHHGKTDGVRTSVYRGDVDRVRHAVDKRSAPKVRQRRGGCVLRRANPELLGNALPEQ